MFSAQDRWAGTMPVSLLPLSPEANDLESIDEDALCPSPLAAPIAVFSLSYPSSSAAPIAEPSSYLLASIEKHIIQSVQYVMSASSSNISSSYRCIR